MSNYDRAARFAFNDFITRLQLMPENSQLQVDTIEDCREALKASYEARSLRHASDTLRLACYTVPKNHKIPNKVLEDMVKETP